MEIELPEIDERKVWSDENHLSFILTVIERFWKLLLIATILGGVFTVTLGYVFRGYENSVTFEATSELRVKRLAFAAYWAKNHPETISPVISFDELLRKLDLEQLAQKIEESLSAQVPNENEGASFAPMGPAEIGETLTLESVGNTPEVLRVIARASTREEAAFLTTTGVNAIVAYNRDLLEQRILEEQAFLANELAILSQNLARATQMEMEFLKQNGFNTYEEIAQELRDQDKLLTKLYASRTQILSEVSSRRAEIEQAQAGLPSSFGRLGDTVVTNLIVELQTLLKKELSMSMVYRSKYPPLQEIRDEIAEKEQTISEAVRRYEEGNSAGLTAWDHLKSLRQKNISLLSKLSALEAEEKVIRERSETLASQLPLVAESSQEFTRIAFDVAGFRNQYNETLGLDFGLRAALRGDLGQLEKLGPVRVAMVSVEKHSYLADLFLGAVIGFFVSLALALLFQLSDTSIRSELDVHRHLKKPLIGTIPDMTLLTRNNKKTSRRSKKPEPPQENLATLKSSVVTVHEPKSPYSEAYRGIRTSFLFATTHSQPKTIMITSAVPAEGKTTTNVNLAVVLAQNGARVLLVDADLRRPHVHSVLRLHRSPGLSEVLGKEVDVDEVIQATAVPNLLAVTSGRLPHNPSELIGSDRMKKLLQKLRLEFDFVLCDAPSVIVVTDPLLLARHVDSVMMVVSANNARRQTILRALKLLETAHCNMVGLILNGLKPTRSRHYYYHYYYNGKMSRNLKRWYHF